VFDGVVGGGDIIDKVFIDEVFSIFSNGKLCDNINGKEDDNGKNGNVKNINRLKTVMEEVDNNTGKKEG
jgi:hypothetical protein